jgi:hypothetical protein
MEKICKNCKFWKSKGQFWDWMKIPVIVGDCEKILTYINRNMPNDRIIAMSETMFIAFTGENFGCIHFEPKEEKEENK